VESFPLDRTVRIAIMRSLLLVAMFLLPFSAAHAANQTVQGSTLLVKNPGSPAQRKVSVKAKEAATNNVIVGNPATNGATVNIAVNGASPSTETYALPPGTGWSGDAQKGFKYRDSLGANGPVKSASIKARNGIFQIKISLDGGQGAIGIVPPNPGTDGCVLFTVSGGDSYSVRFANGQVTNKGSALFKVTKPTGQGSCLPALTPTPSGTPTLTRTPTPTRTPTLDFPNIPPPGPAPLRYRDLVFSNVTTTTNVVYGSAVNNSGQTVTLLLDIYAPTGDAVTERPAIVWVHGGSFCCGNKNSPEIVDEATTFARKGYFNVSINYRLEPGGCTGPPTPTCIIAIQEAREDAQTAVRFLRTNQATYGIDETRIAIAGTSAGAITALNVGFFSAEDPSAAVGGAVSLSGAHLFSVINAGDAPSLLFHGTADGTVPYQWAVNTWDSAQDAGLDSFLTTWTGAGHVPYSAHRTEILDQTTNFLYWELDLTNAAQ
jgi:acetyl esterase/lipase